MYTILNYRNVVVLKAEDMKTRSEDMDNLETLMNNKSLKKTQVRGYLLEYFNHTGDAKLPAIWSVLKYSTFIKLI